MQKQQKMDTTNEAKSLNNPSRGTNFGEALPTYGMAAATALMGVRGFRSTKSVPSLAAGLGFGTLFGVSGYLLQDPATSGSGRTIALGTLPTIFFHLPAPHDTTRHAHS
jgi:hypothetical protein